MEATLRLASSDAEKKLQESQELVAQKVNDLDQLKATLNETKKSLGESQSKNQLLVSNEQQLSGKLQTFSGKVAELQAEVQSLSEAKKIATEEFKQRCKNYESDKTSLTGKCTSLQKEVEDTKEALKSLKSESVAHKNALNEMNVAKAKLEQDLTAVNEILGNRSTQIKEQKAHIDLLDKRKNELESELESTQSQLATQAELCANLETNLAGKENVLKDLETQVNSHESTILELQASLKAATREKSEAEEKTCQLQSLWETEKAKQAEKLSDLAKAKEILLNSKVQIQRELEECQSDLNQLRAIQQKAKDEMAATLKKHSKEMADLQALQVCILNVLPL